MARIFLQEEGLIAVWGDWLNEQPMPENWTQIAEYDEQSHLAMHNLLSSESTKATWDSNSEQLFVNAVLILDRAWIDNAQAELEEKAQQAQALAELRAANLDSLAISDFATESQAIQTLAKKIVWLEAELQHLREG